MPSGPSFRDKVLVKPISLHLDVARRHLQLSQEELANLAAPGALSGLFVLARPPHQTHEAESIGQLVQRIAPARRGGASSSVRQISAIGRWRLDHVLRVVEAPGGEIPLCGMIRTRPT
jgi:hypothetical protein